MGVEATDRDRRTRDDEHFDHWSRRYDRSPAQWLLFGPVQRSVVASIAPQLPPSSVVLDIGCGTGRLLGRIGTALPSAALVGLDRSAGMAERAKRQWPDLWIERGSAETLPHPDCSVDAVTTTLSFHHWSDKAAALQEVFRVLRPGGLFALTDMTTEDAARRLARLPFLGRRVTHDLPTVRERERLITEAGFQVLDSAPTLHRRWIPLTLAQRPGR